MKFFWSKEKCGNHAIVGTWADFHDIIRQEVNAEYQTICKDHNIVNKNKQYQGPGLFVTNRVLKRMADDKLGTPFSHVKVGDLRKVFFRYKNGSDGF